MKLKNILETINDIKIDDSVKQIEKLYETELNSFVKKLISVKAAQYEYKNYYFNKIDINDILNFKNLNNINFLKLKMIPLFDVSQNKIITFDVSKQVYAVFNTEKNQIILQNELFGFLIFNFIKNN